MEKFSRILVTGGAGFIGGTLIRTLLKTTNSKIFNIDKMGYASDLTSINKLNEAKGRHIHINIDLKNKTETFEAIKNSSPDIIIHLAAESHVDRSIDNPGNFIDSNVIGTFNLLEAVRKYWKNLNPKRRNLFRLYHISTDEVFGSLSYNDEPFKESTNYSPRSPYSASKAASDHFVRSWYSTYGIPILVSNCSNNFGPWQFPEKLIPVAILKALNNQPIPLYGDGKHIRDWLFVEDHVSAIMTIANSGEIGRTYCIGSDGEKSNEEVLTTICNILNEIKPTSFDYANLIERVKDRPGHDRRYSIDSTRLRDELGWMPKVSFEKAIRKTIFWYINNLDWSENVLIRSNYQAERLGLEI